MYYRFLIEGNQQNITMAKSYIKYLPEKWVVEWYEKSADRNILHKEYFNTKEEALAFQKQKDKEQPE